MGLSAERLRDVLLRFAQRDDGQIAVVFALAFLPIMIAVGSALDYTRGNSARTSLQQALDAAVLAGAKDGTSNWKETASNFFTSNLKLKGATAGTPSFSRSEATYTGTVTGAVPTTVMNVIAIKSLPLFAKSVVNASVKPQDNSCLLTLGQGQSASTSSMRFNGGPNLNMVGCTIRSNTSMDCNGHGGNATASIAAGSASGCTNPQSNQSPAPDIYKPLASNITTKCGAFTMGVTWTAGTIPVGPAVITANSGGYTEYHICGTLTVTGNGYLTGNAPSVDSVIVIENGGLAVADSATIKTTRTTIVLTGNNSAPSSIAFPNGGGHAATLSLSPSTGSDNPWQGISLYQDPSLTNGVDDTWDSAATFNADGVVYLPQANVMMKGNGASNNSRCTKFVVNTLTTDGSVNLNFSQTSGGCSALGVKQYSVAAIRLSQ